MYIKGLVNAAVDVNEGIVNVWQMIVFMGDGYVA